MSANTMAKCYTFYSYKGGSGRTTTAVNTVKHLADYLGASAKKPILLVDADLESAGLTYFLDCEKKFCSALDGSVHTNKIFEATDAFDCDKLNGRQLFGIANEVTVDISAETKEHIAKLIGYGDGTEEQTKKLVEDAFDGLKLTLTMHTMFKKIVEAIYNEEHRDVAAIKEHRKHAEICSVFDKKMLVRLIRNIVTVNSENCLNYEKREKKQALLQEFLPATGFVDVSEYFDLEPGAIKFIGVAVRYDGQQVMLNGSEDVLMAFLEACGKNGYSAVVFDSGAGVQSSAHILHAISDVLVYCLRPAVQFLRGTALQLDCYKKGLSETCSLKDEGKKSVILLPTAVPLSDESNAFCRHNFTKINALAIAYSHFIDRTFCTPDTCLNEIELFKWNECILGVSGKREFNTNELVANQLNKYIDVETMPEDAKKAYNTYNLLAKKIVENT